MHAASFRPLAFLTLALALPGLACSTGDVADTTGAFSASLGSGNNVDDNVDLDESTSDSGADTTSSTSDTSQESSSTSSSTSDTTDESSSTEESTETGVVDPCPLICEGMADATPISCDAPYIIGRTAAKSEFFFGGNTTGSMDSDNGVCGPVDNPDNWDSGRDHFFRIYLYPEDEILVTMTGNFGKRVKVHDEEDCIGNAKDCSLDDGVLSYTAPSEGWFTIVADGQSVAFMDWGDYTLRVQLTLGGPEACNCP